MIALICFCLTLFALPFKSKIRLEAENASLRHQVIVLQRRMRARVQLTNGDRLFLVMLYRWFPSVLKAITIIRPETLVRWHRGETHLRRVLKSYAEYYNEMRTHRSLDKDAPLSRPVQRNSIMAHALLGGLYHHYVRV